MQIIKTVFVVGLLLGNMNVAALSEQPEIGVSIGSHSPPAKLGSSKPFKYVNTSQIVCLDDTRTGSRIKKRRCQSVASWRAELSSQHARIYLLEM